MSIFDRPYRESDFWQHAAEYLTDEERNILLSCSDEKPTHCPNCNHEIKGEMYGDSWVYFIDWSCDSCKAVYQYYSG